MKNLQKGVLSIMLVLVIGVVVIVGIGGGVYYYAKKNQKTNIIKDINNTNNTRNTDTIKVDNSQFKTCNTFADLGCSPISRGAETIDPAPIVCGCIPTCSAKLYLIASKVNGFWPDGSSKGSFHCSPDQVQ
ncbi:MAG: hypothetical protein A2908_02605 [Candidatus Staskawiczbacteria bacterium RIFCSPLOWO2_01_FULL_38_12b]|uniref:Uncharacterized protein n=1 Tax=Candidatus Staskawiczbacteria bacterium RIFCSPLOWO2_01_FULL_38_12b TaxID=1802214 RepID=A0A1G2IBH4_9BACT|nr:MAG: hypothetical protein A2908_02605 [Candidatus Staskawiczbacteria bacterium RIFCSPLOWO2_01_FULL_38_12b]